MAPNVRLNYFCCGHPYCLLLLGQCQPGLLSLYAGAEGDKGRIQKSLCAAAKKEASAEFLKSSWKNPLAGGGVAALTWRRYSCRQLCAQPSLIHVLRDCYSKKEVLEKCELFAGYVLVLWFFCAPGVSVAVAGNCCWWPLVHHCCPR